MPPVSDLQPWLDALSASLAAEKTLDDSLDVWADAQAAKIQELLASQGVSQTVIDQVKSFVDLNDAGRAQVQAAMTRNTAADGAQ